MDEKTNFMDRILDLPPFIIHHIMSYFSAKELAQSSLLSKRWNELRKSLPIMDFDQSHFVGKLFICGCHNNRWRRLFLKRIKNFIQFVDVSLDRFCKLEYRLHKFKLHIALLEFYRPYSVIQKWIELASENGVREIDLHVKIDMETIWFTLPQTIYINKSLTTLKLYRCKLEEPTNTIGLHSLKNLVLEDVSINDQTLMKLTSGCHMLEDISFKYCRGLNRICFSELPNLEVLMFRENCFEIEKIEIIVPSLQKVDLDIHPSCVLDMIDCPHLTHLRLRGLCYRDQEFDNIVTKFPSLEDLSVEYPLFGRIKIYSNVIKRLRIDVRLELKGIDVNAPNLVSFCCVVAPPPLFKVKASQKCKWEVELSKKEGNVDTSWYLHVKESLSSAKQITTFTLTIKPKEVTFDLDEFRSRSSLLPFKVCTMDFSTDAPPSMWESLMDGIFCMCYPQLLNWRTDDPTSTEFARWLYEEIKGKDGNCCNSRHVKCWRHYLKDVELQFKPNKKINFLPGGKVEFIDETVPDTNNWNDALPMLPGGCLMFHLSWCFE